MKCEVIAATADVPPGFVLRLSADQVRRRAHLLRRVDPSDPEAGVEAMAAVTFKRGETFEVLAGDVKRDFGPGIKVIDSPRQAEKSRSDGAGAASPKEGEQA